MFKGAKHVQDPIEIIKKQIQGTYPDSKFRFDRFDVQLSLLSMLYDDLDVKSQHPIALQRSVFTNDTGVQNSQTFTVDKTTSDSFTWSLTEALKVSSKFKVGIPFVGDSETTVELSFESTQSQTTSVSRHWGYSAQVQVPPHSKIETSFSILEGNIDTAFTARFQVRGYMKISFDISNPGQRPDWRYCEGEIANMIKGGYCVSNPATFECGTTGRFTGVAATTYVVHTRPLDGGEPQEIDRGVMVWGRPRQLPHVPPQPIARHDQRESAPTAG
jgi:Clostridium epsilon toxin ETX/Bacillus mosquitocidal toxin MTX2